MIDTPIATQLTNIMNAMATGIDNMLNGKNRPAHKKKYGFTLLVFEFSDQYTPGTQPRINYISNAKRNDMLKAMKEFISNATGNRHDKALAGYGAALCDVHRNGGSDYAEELFKESGISFKKWLTILDDERDQEIIKGYIAQ